jgi:hypothetical protein
MKRHLSLIPVIFVTAAAIADSQPIAYSDGPDAQAQAATLLSGLHPSAGMKTAGLRSPLPTSMTADAQAQAAVLLSGVRPGNNARQAPGFVDSSRVQPLADAQEHAATLLSGSRVFMHSRVQVQRAQKGAHTTGEAL